MNRRGVAAPVLAVLAVLAGCSSADRSAGPGSDPSTSPGSATEASAGGGSTPASSSSSAAAPAPTTGAAEGSTVPPLAAGPPGAVWRMGYYPMWERFAPEPSAFPYEKLTHVIVGNLVPTEDGCCSIPWESQYQEPWDQFERDVIAGAHQHGTQAMLMLGGQGGNPDEIWQRKTASDDDAAAFAQSIVDYAVPRGYDGVDLDWEEGFNGNGEHLVRLARELRERWPDGVLTFPLAPLWNDGDDWSWVPAMEYLDRVNGMTYLAISDWGGYDGPWHIGAIEEGDDDPSDGTHPYSLARLVGNLTERGVPPSKIGIGIGFFGACWTDDNQDGRYPTGPIGFEGETGAALTDGYMSLGEIARSYAPAMDYVWDEVARVPYLTASPPAGGNPENAPPLAPCSYISYEDERSVEEKARFVKDNGLGGAIIWTVPQGFLSDGSSPVLDAVAAGFS